jgi:hypothetical protein
MIQMSLKRTTRQQRRRRERGNTGNGKQHQGGARKIHKRYHTFLIYWFPTWLFVFCSELKFKEINKNFTLLGNIFVALQGISNEF